MEIEINNVKYRPINDWSVKESVQSTDVMSITIDCEGKDVPEPYDLMKITDGEENIGGDFLVNGLKIGTGIKNGSVVLSNSTEKERSSTWEDLGSSTWEDLE